MKEVKSETKTTSVDDCMYLSHLNAIRVSMYMKCRLELPFGADYAIY